MTTMYYAFAGASVGALLVFGIGFMSRGGMTPVRLTLAGAALIVHDSTDIYLTLK